MTSYSQKFRLQMVQRMVGPNRMSATALAEEVGVPQPTLSRWLREARTLSCMSDDEKKQETAPPRPPNAWTPEERLQALLEASRLDESEFGTFLRRRGLNEAQVVEWRAAALKALARPAKKRRGRSPAEKKVRQLESELQRKDKALAEAAALLVLQGKAEALWGAEGESTMLKSGKKRSG